jgi:hypothetical protein
MYIIDAANLGYSDCLPATSDTYQEGMTGAGHDDSGDTADVFHGILKEH